jgi:excisionase family DNA binding protein
MENVVPLRERLSVTVQVAASFTGISRSRLYEMLKAGDIEGCTVRGRRLVKVRSLLRLLGEGDKSEPGGERAA